MSQTKAQLIDNLVQPITGALGSAAAPTFSFTADPNTGLFSPGADAVALATAGTNRLHITSTGLVGIGTSAPNTTLDVLSGSSNTAGDALTDQTFAVTGPNRAFSTHVGVLNVATNTAAGIDIGGSIGFGGRWSGTTQAGFALIKGAKETSSTSYASYLAFYTRPDNSVMSERMRIDSSGRLLVGTSTSNAPGSLNSKVQVEALDFTGSISAVRNSVDTGGPQLVLGKSRGTSLGAKTIVASGDSIGSINFFGADGTNFVEGASIQALVDGTPGANDMPGRLVFSVTRDGQSSPTAAARINSNGRFSVFSADNVLSTFYSTKAAGTSDFLFVGGYGATDINGTSNSIYIYTNGNIQNTNNSYGQISDVKLKENIVDASSQWSDLKAVRVRNFNFKEGQTHRQIGVIAQELEEVSPGLVYETPDRDEGGNETGEVTKGVNYSVLYMKAVKALQEAMERIEQLETSNADLLARVTALEGA